MWVLGICLAFSISSPIYAQASSLIGISSGYQLEAILGKPDGSQELKSWTTQELSTLKQATYGQFRGVLLSTLVENAMAGLPPDRKAQVDLVILKNEDGTQAQIPRSFITRFPVLLALADPKSSSSSRGPVFSLVPASTMPKIKNEQLPVESYSLSKVKEIELTNYKDRYGIYFLKRRTDPVAMRGEKIFVENCLGCHTPGYGSSIQDKSRSLASTNHPAVRGLPRLSERDRRSLLNYLDAYQREN